MNTFRRFSGPIFLVFSILIWLYLILRAVHIQPVHDEIATFFHYVHRGYIWPGEALWDANNHLLNSLLTRQSYLFFGSEPWALRLANLLLFPVFAGYVYLQGKRLQTVPLTIAFWLSMLTAHYLVEHFAYSRGYGLAMAFLMGGLYHGSEYLSGNGLKRHLIAALLMLNLAVFSSLTLLNLYVILLGFLGLKIILTRRILSLHTLILVGLSTPLVFFVRLATELKEKGLLYYGTQEGFWSLTIETLSKLFGGVFQDYLKILASIAFAFAIGVILTRLVSKKRLPIGERGFFFSAFLILAFIAVQTQVMFLDTNYPEDRVGLYFYPLMILAFLFSVGELKPGAVRWAAPVLLLVFPLHFVLNMNFQKSTLWFFDIIPERFIEKVKRESSDLKHPPSIGGYHMRGLVWAYMNYSHGGDQNQVQFNDFPGTTADYQLFKGNQITEEVDSLYERIDHGEISDVYLLRRKSFLERKPVIEGEIDMAASDAEFLSIHEGKCDSLVGENLLLRFSLNIRSPERPLVTWMVLSIHDADGENLIYERFPLDWVATSFSPFDGNYSMYTPSIPEEAENLKVYIWNVYKKPFEEINGGFEITRLSRGGNDR